MNNEIPRLEEAGWLQKLQQGDEQALTAVMRHYYSDLFHYGSRLSLDEEMIKDCIQEVFISLWQRRETATVILSLRYYLLRAVKNKVLKSLYYSRRKAAGPDQLQKEYDFFYESSVEQMIIDRQLSEEKAARLKSTLASLSRRQHEAIYLKFYQRLDHGQIAELMNISRQSVYNLLHESILRLRQVWQSAFTSGG